MTYRDDPEWQAASAEYTKERENDETSTDALVRRLTAARRQYEIEARYESAA